MVLKQLSPIVEHSDFGGLVVNVVVFAFAGVLVVKAEVLALIVVVFVVVSRLVVVADSFTQLHGC